MNDFFCERVNFCVQMCVRLYSFSGVWYGAEKCGVRGVLGSVPQSNANSGERVYTQKKATAIQNYDVIVIIEFTSLYEHVKWLLLFEISEAFEIAFMLEISIAFVPAIATMDLKMQ